MLALAANLGPSMEMSETKQQEQDAVPAKPKARKDWELFWRIIAGLMLLVIAWVAWVLYQISPRSVVTPIAYSGQNRPIANQPSASGVAATPAPSAPPPAGQAAAPESGTEQTQAAARSGAEVQSAGGEKTGAAIKGEGLRLATEIATPPAENRGITATQEVKPGGVPADPAAGAAAGRARP